MEQAVQERRFLREAALVLLLSKLIVRWLPSERIFSWVARPLRKKNRFAVDQIDWVVWSVKTMASKPYIKAICLPQALAAHAMLRRRGIPSRLCLGVAHVDGNLQAHSWIETSATKLSDVEGFKRIADFCGDDL